MNNPEKKQDFRDKYNYRFFMINLLKSEAALLEEAKEKSGRSYCAIIRKLIKEARAGTLTYKNGKNFFEEL